MSLSESQEKFLRFIEIDSSSNKMDSNPIELAYFYTISSLLITAMSFIKEQNWLKDKKDKLSKITTNYEDFLAPYFFNDLLPIYFLKDFLLKSGSGFNKKISKASVNIQSNVIRKVMSESANIQKEFLLQSLLIMSKFFVDEESLQLNAIQSDGHRGLNLYRTFDGLDEIFKLNYQLDRDMIVDSFAKERLYQNAGVGVQSGYSTILLALENINVEDGQMIIDLGSGYGRVGLVCSLLRPKIEFVGYEFVAHRVEVSNIAKKNLELPDTLNFIVQDLSLENFKLPSADVFYLYDPFTEETYKYILEQIVLISETKKVTIVTKGNARIWLDKISKQNKWPEAMSIDEGNLCIYKSC